MPRLANFFQERKLKKQGYKYIAGVDEVGIGAWAGPLFAAAIILSSRFKRKVCDSKQFCEEKREKIAKIIKKKNKWIGIGMARKKEIDKFGLTKAKRIAVLRALENLPQKPDFVLFDGIDFVKNLRCPYQFIIKGDEKINSIACASIIAKVERDKVMRQLANKFSFYGFGKNKGYGTKSHIEAIKKYGICKIHRKSYKPIKEFKQNGPVNAQMA